MLEMMKTRVGRKLIMSEVNKITYLKAYASKVDDNTKLKVLRETFNWFFYNQSVMKDDGLGTYRVCEGWTSSYPETTGYIVPSLIAYYHREGNSIARDTARRALNWLVSIQKPSGGWQSGYVDQNKDEIVFNTGQVIRGMVAGYKEFDDLAYLKSAVAACRWLTSIQHEDGYFDQHVFMNSTRVYESYSVAPMLEVWKITNNDSYKECAEKCIDWIIQHKQLDNGWFEDCDNTLHKNDKPILHTIAYTIDGILDCGIMLDREDYIKAAVKPTKILLHYFLDHNTLPGRWDRNWNGSEALITTGCAQMAIIWSKLYDLTGDVQYQKGHLEMNALLSAIHQRHVLGEKDTRGAIFGSFPFWGRYESFSCPNWASKYLVDALMLDIYA